MFEFAPGRLGDTCSGQGKVYEARARTDISGDESVIGVMCGGVGCRAGREASVGVGWWWGGGQWPVLENSPPCSLVLASTGDTGSTHTHALTFTLLYMINA